MGLSTKNSRSIAALSTKPFNQASYTNIPSPVSSRGKISTKQLTTLKLGSPSNHASCFSKRSGCIRSSASMRATYAPRHKAKPRLGASTIPRWSDNNTLKRPSRRFHSKSRSPLSSSEPSSMATTSKSSQLCAWMLSSVSANVAAALNTGSSTDTRGVFMVASYIAILNELDGSHGGLSCQYHSASICVYLRI